MTDTTIDKRADKKRVPRVPFKRTLLGRLLRCRTFQVGMTILGPILLFILIAPYFLGYSALEMTSNFMQAPSSHHLFGTDSFGRDLAIRVCRGGRNSLLLGLAVMGTSTAAGVILGLSSAISTRMDLLMVRIVDIFMAFPEILLALGIMAILGQRVVNILIALTIVYAAKTARVARSSVLSISRQTYVEGARALGVPTWRILLFHILPNAMSPVLVQGTFVFGWAIILESGLSFIGVGVQPPTPSLGNILSDARIVLRIAPWITFFPGALIMLMVLGINFLGDGLREITDPKFRESQGKRR